jgi:hypothetical protein
LASGGIVLGLRCVRMRLHTGKLVRSNKAGNVARLRGLTALRGGSSIAEGWRVTRDDDKSQHEPLA